MSFAGSLSTRLDVLDEVASEVLGMFAEAKASSLVALSKRLGVLSEAV